MAWRKARPATPENCTKTSDERARKPDRVGTRSNRRISNSENPLEQTVIDCYDNLSEFDAGY
jgi:hypothetical protein